MKLTFQQRALKVAREERRARIRLAATVIVILLAAVAIASWGFSTPRKIKRPEYVFFGWQTFSLNAELDTL